MDSDPLVNSVFPISGLSVPDYFLIGLTFLLIVINFIISGAEVAFFSLSRKDSPGSFPEETNPKAERVKKLLNAPERLLGAIVIAYHFLNILIISLLFYLLSKLPFFNTGSGYRWLSVVVVGGFVVVLLEIIPKIFASVNPKKFSIRHIRLIEITNQVMKPFSYLLAKTTGLLSKSGIQKKYGISMDDISRALEITSNEITQDREKDMLEGIIRFKDKTVDDIMISRSSMVALDIETPFTSVIDFIVNAGFSRIPAYEENPDNIKGILYVKDLLPYIDRKDDFRWQSLIRPAYFVPSAKRIDDLLEEFRTNKKHMAIVVDEYGGTKGIVTLEDILEEIVGDISDEYDEEEKPPYTVAADGSYIFEGTTSLEDFIEITGVPEKDFEKMMDEVDTIAGLMLELKGDFPKRKETIEYKDYSFQAEEMSKIRITKVRFSTKTQRLKENDHS